MELPEFKIIAGLGNPGEEYEKTFHNAGFLALEALWENKGFKRMKGKDFEYARSEEQVLIRPLTYMNESGRAIQEALAYFKLEPKDLLVIQDDSDIELGDIKFSYDRNAAGHKGIGSIIQHLGTKGFWRLRVGVRTRPGKAGEFVLKKMSKTEAQKFDQSLEKAKEKLTEKREPSA